jgi:hypothetical protein
MALLNTHTAVKKFIQHGFSEGQAEIIVEVINDQSNELATKQDLKILEVSLESKVVRIEISLNWIKIVLLAALSLLVKLTFFN